MQVHTSASTLPLKKSPARPQLHTGYEGRQTLLVHGRLAPMIVLRARPAHKSAESGRELYSATKTLVVVSEQE